MENPDRASRIDAFASQVVGDGVLGNYVVIGEVVDDSGIDLRVIVSPGLAPWTAKGMIATALDVIAVRMPMGDVDDDEEYFDDDDYEDI